jgi:hypothetical protein
VIAASIAAVAKPPRASLTAVSAAASGVAVGCCAPLPAIACLSCVSILLFCTSVNCCVLGRENERKMHEMLMT